MSNTLSPLVSIIVPVYKTEQFLEQCINSILSQTYPHFELILVDDGSPDNSAEICDNYSVVDRRIHVIHKKNGGVSSSRKAGIEFASGDYIMFVDSDDWIEPDTLSACIEAACQHDAGCVMFNYIREYPNKRNFVALFENEFHYNIADSEQYVHRRIVGLMGVELEKPHRIDSLSSICMKLYRSDTVQKGRIVDTLDIGTSEDTIFNLYALDNIRISYIARYLYHYRKANAQSITTEYKPDLVHKWDSMYELIQDYIVLSGKEEIYHIPFFNRVACGMIGLGLNETANPNHLMIKAITIKEILLKPLYQKAFSQLDTTYCGLEWKLFFFLCKIKAAFPLTILLQIMNYLRAHFDN